MEISKAQAPVGDTVMRHFEEGLLPRLELKMLPRDNNRVVGPMRAAVCSAFNYCRKYPKKLDLFIEILKYTVNYAMAYKHYDEQRVEANKQAAVNRALLENKSEVE